MIPIWVLFFLLLVLIPIHARTYPPLSSIADPVLPTEKKPPFSQIPKDNEADSPGSVNLVYTLQMLHETSCSVFLNALRLLIYLNHNVFAFLQLNFDQK